MSLELSAQLDRDGGIEKIAGDIADASPEERARLGSDKAYQNNVLSGMNDQQKEIALAVAEKGKFEPEDRVRAKIIGWGGGSEVANATMAMKPEELAQAEKNYAHVLSRRFQNSRSQ